MKKALLSLILYCSVSLSAQISSLPASITLGAGQTRTDTASSRPGNGVQTSFGNSNLNFTLQGASGSKYTLNIQDTTTTFYVNSFTLSAYSNLELNNFHTINFNQSVNVGANSSFTISNSGNTLPDASYTDYGNRSKIRFARNSSLILGAHSNVVFTRTLFFIAGGSVELNSNSSLKIESSNAIRFEKSFTNNGGEAILTTAVGNNLGVYNVGYDDSITNFTNNGGNIIVYGNFFNGGQALIDGPTGFNPYDPPFLGGGNLILNGGTMEVTGKLISQSGGLSKIQNSSIQIYGGTLIVRGGLENNTGSSLIFGLAGNEMGKLQGALTNNNGVVAVDMKGAQINHTYNIITGAITGFDGNSLVVLNNPNPNFLNVKYQNGSVTLQQIGSEGSDGSGGQTRFEEYIDSLADNKKGIANVLLSQFDGDQIKLLQEVTNVDVSIDDTEKTIQQTLAQPQQMRAMFKGDLLLAPLQKTRTTQRRKTFSRRLAATEIIRFDNGKRINPFYTEPEKEHNIYFNPIGGILSGKDLDGSMAGFELGINLKKNEYASRFYISYAYGQSTQDLSTQSTDTRANLMSIGLANLYKYNIFETTLNASFMLGAFEIDNKWKEAQMLNSSSQFNNYEFNLGIITSAKFGKTLSFQPFIGIQNYFEMQDGFKQSLGLVSKAYNSYILDGVLGVEAAYTYRKNLFYTRLSFENRLYNSHKEVFVRADTDELVYENQSYNNILGASIGSQFDVFNAIKINAEALYKHYNIGLNYFGLGLSFSYAF